MRSRLFGLVVIFIGTGLLGTANIGLMAEWFGASNAIYVMGVEGIIILTVAVLYWPALRRAGLPAGPGG